MENFRARYVFLASTSMAEGIQRNPIQATASGYRRHGNRSPKRKPATEKTRIDRRHGISCYFQRRGQQLAGSRLSDHTYILIRLFCIALDGSHCREDIKIDHHDCQSIVRFISNTLLHAWNWFLKFPRQGRRLIVRSETEDVLAKRARSVTTQPEIMVRGQWMQRDRDMW